MLIIRTTRENLHHYLKQYSEAIKKLHTNKSVTNKLLLFSSLHLKI